MGGIVMEKTRVNKGEKYWYIDEFGRVESCTDEYKPYPCLVRFKKGNYFRTEVEAESMACKFRALLKGAEMIEVTKAVLAFNGFLTYLKENGVLSYEKACEYMKEFQSKIK